MEALIVDTDFLALASELARTFAGRASAHDEQGQFVSTNYQDLKEHGFFRLTIPEELGGHGLPYSQVCEIVKSIGKSCGSTALAFSMHNHLLAANVWKYKKGQGAEAMLRKVADEQPVLISTGAKDWLESNGEAKKTEGGYLVSGFKHFASQSAAGDLVITTARYQDKTTGNWKVLHFSVPMTAPGVSHLNNWNTLGMRGTGSHTIKFEEVFVPENAVALEREAGEFHPVWNVVLTVAMPLIMSAYVGIAERATEIVVDKARNLADMKPHMKSEIGKMLNLITTARVMWEDMVRLTNEFDFAPEDRLGNEILMRKTVVANTVIDTVTKAMEINGGQSYFKNQEMERLFRDVQAARFHPLAEPEQLLFSGEFSLRTT